MATAGTDTLALSAGGYNGTAYTSQSEEFTKALVTTELGAS
jgi:hypothetical protein